MGLNAPVIGQNDVYPGSNQSASEYATSAQTPVSSSAINAGYDPKTDAYSGQMMAKGGITSIRRFAGEDGSQVMLSAPGMNAVDPSIQAPTQAPTQDPMQGHYEMNGDSGRYVEAPKETGSWTPDQPVKLQSMDQMLAGDASGKDFNPTEHGYEWNGRGFVNPNGSTLSVDQNGFVTQALPSLKDYEFNGKYWNPAGENISWNPEKNQTAYKIGGVEVPIERQATKGIAALTDAEGKPRMQIDSNGQPIFTEPEGLKQSKLWMDEYGAPLLASGVLGGTTALASGAFGAGTTLTNAGATGTAGVGAGAAPGYGISTSATPPGIYSIGTTPTGIGSIGTGALNTGVPTSLGITEGSALTGTGIGAGNTAGMNMYQKAALGTLALKGLTSGAGTQGTTTATTQSSSPTYTTTTSTPVAFNPGKNTVFPTTTPIYNTPMMGSNQNMGLAYQPMTFKYYAHGGIADLGGYAAGGKLLKGPGDGMSDSIVANIGGKQPARLADGEFVVPADVVSHLGNGSTDAGAKHLYKMMDNIRKARTGNPKQGKKINADKFLPRN
jgi:hypothetical protein